MGKVLKVPLVLEPQPEGGYTVTSPIIPEMVTEGDTVEEVLAHVQDALAAAVELYEDLGRPIPASLQQASGQAPIWFETLLATP
jgi:antitoxin HicB